MFFQEEHYFKKQDTPRSWFLNTNKRNQSFWEKMADSRVGMKKILMPERKCLKKIEGTVPS